LPVFGLSPVEIKANVKGRVGAPFSHEVYPSMIDVLLKTLPFFAIVGLGYGAARTAFFPEVATAYLTKFVFYFALPAMIIRFSANLSFADLINVPFISAYLSASFLIYLLATGVAMLRRRNVAEAAVEAQCATIGNVGFLGIPMLAMLMGPEAVLWVMLVLAIDQLVFGSLIVILIVGSRDGRMSFGVLRTVGLGLIKNPMIMAMASGLLCSSSGVSLPAPASEFLRHFGGGCNARCAVCYWRVLGQQIR
jgi:predicted permease